VGAVGGGLLLFVGLVTGVAVLAAAEGSGAVAWVGVVIAGALFAAGCALMARPFWLLRLVAPRRVPTQALRGIDAFLRRIARGKIRTTPELFSLVAFSGKWRGYFLPDALVMVKVSGFGKKVLMAVRGSVHIAGVDGPSIHGREHLVLKMPGLDIKGGASEHTLRRAELWKAGRLAEEGEEAVTSLAEATVRGATVAAAVMAWAGVFLLVFLPLLAAGLLAINDPAHGGAVVFGAFMLASGAATAAANAVERRVKQ
jgi:hypothetical protein